MDAPTEDPQPTIQPVRPTPPPQPLATAAPIPRDAAAQRVAEPLASVLALANVLSGGLTSRGAYGSGTRRELAPAFDRISAILAEAGAAPLMPSRNLDLFAPSSESVTVMGVEFVGNLQTEAFGLLAECRALAQSQASALLNYTVSRPGTGIVTRTLEAARQLQAEVERRIAGIRQSIEQAAADVRAAAAEQARRLLNFMDQWRAQFFAELRRLAEGLGGVVAAGAAPMMPFIIAIAVVLFLAKRKPA